MLKEDHAEPAVALAPPAGSGGPHWRALLEDRWRTRLQEVTELSLAYHQAAPAEGRDGAAESPRAQRLLRRTVAARRKLADIEEALTRLAAGSFGRCERCGARLPDELLAAIPETRYCPSCGISLAARLVIAACAADGQRGEREDFAGPETLSMTELMEQFLAARGLHQRIRRARLPKSLQAAITAGNTAPGARRGTTTWAEWLTRPVAPRHLGQDAASSR